MSGDNGAAAPYQSAPAWARTAWAPTAWADGLVIGESGAIQSAILFASQIGSSRAPAVLICGESGTGKELFARGVYAASEQSHGPFVAVNCAALPETLLESELFGHEDEGAAGPLMLKRGILEVAGGGTVFLDDVGAIPLRLQRKLFRALAQRSFRRLGGSRSYPVHARVIAATSTPLERAVDTNAFREDLFEYLSAVRLDLPPLRERGGDVELLARHFLATTAREHGTSVPTLSAPAAEALAAHPWPGNVRELKNTIERAAMVCGGTTIQRRHVMFQRRHAVSAEGAGSGDVALIRIPPGGKSLDAIIHEAIHATLVLTQGNMSATARILGISRPTLARKMHEAGLMHRSVVEVC